MKGKKAKTEQDLDREENIIISIIYIIFFPPVIAFLLAYLLTAGFY